MMLCATSHAARARSLDGFWVRMNRTRKTNAFGGGDLLKAGGRIEVYQWNL